MECSSCGTSFDVDEARASFNHYYSGSAAWQYDVDAAGGLCWNCASDDAESRWMDGTLKAADGDPPPADHMEALMKRLGLQD